jgi:hypothetical protein
VREREREREREAERKRTWEDDNIGHPTLLPQRCLASGDRAVSLGNSRPGSHISEAAQQQKLLDGLKDRKGGSPDTSSTSQVLATRQDFSTCQCSLLQNGPACLGLCACSFYLVMYILIY